jgi:hypothetical protein
MEVTLEAAPTTPEMTFLAALWLHCTSASSMLLMDPRGGNKNKKKQE